VLAYRELVAERPLTDEEWKAMLDAGDAPDGPEWRKRIEVEP
jgi:hypothetical protein